MSALWLRALTRNYFVYTLFTAFCISNLSPQLVAPSASHWNFTSAVTCNDSPFPAPTPFHTHINSISGAPHELCFKLSHTKNGKIFLTIRMWYNSKTSNLTLYKSQSHQKCNTQQLLTANNKTQYPESLSSSFYLIFPLNTFLPNTFL